VKHDLTAPFVKAVTPESGERIWWDVNTPGLGLRVRPSGGKSFIAVYRHAGRNRWFTIGSVDRVGLSDARKAARAIIARATLGQDPQADRIAERAAARAGDTFADVCARFTQQVAMKKKSWRQGDAARRRHVLPKIGDKKIGAITRVDIERIFDDLTARGTAATANQVIKHTSSVFTWAVKKGLVIANPCAGIEQHDLASRERVLSDAELPEFWDALDAVDDVAACALKALLLLGQRPGEIRMMRQRDLNVGEFTFEQHRGDGRVTRIRARGAWWDLPGAPDPDGTWLGTKNGKPHRVWIPQSVLAQLQHMIDAKAVHVFRRANGRVVGTLHGHAAAICERLAWTDARRLTPHDLRRTHGTCITGLGFGRNALNRIENHAEGGIADVYDRSKYETENRIVQEAVAARLLTLAERHADADNVVELKSVTA
jgi:integrase